MQCSKCGTPLEEGNVFCPNCGAVSDMALVQPEPVAEEPAEVIEAPVMEEIPEAVETPVIEEAETPVTETVPEEKSRKLPAIVWYLGAALLIAMVIIIVFAGRPKPCTSALDTYIGVVYEGDFSQIRQLAPPEYWQYREKQGVSWGQEALRLQIIFLNERYIQLLHFGEQMQVSYEIQSQERIESERMVELEQWAEEKYGISPEKITEGYFLQYTLSFSGSDDAVTMDGERYALLIDKQWYLVESYTAQWETYYEFPVFNPRPDGVLYGSVME